MKLSSTIIPKKTLEKLQNDEDLEKSVKSIDLDNLRQNSGTCEETAESIKMTENENGCEQTFEKNIILNHEKQEIVEDDTSEKINCLICGDHMCSKCKLPFHKVCGHFCPVSAESADDIGLMCLLCILEINIKREQTSVHGEIIGQSKKFCKKVI